MTIEELVKNEFEYFGLKFKVSVEHLFKENRVKVVIFSEKAYDWFDDGYPKAQFLQYVNELTDSIKKSPMMKAKEQEISELNKEIERLKEFETYYNMEYNLRNGKA